MSVNTNSPVNNTVTDLLDIMLTYKATEMKLQVGQPPTFKVKGNNIISDQYPAMDYAELESELEAISIVDKKSYRYERFNYLSEDPSMSRPLKVFIASTEPQMVVTFREIV